MLDTSADETVWRRYRGRICGQRTDADIIYYTNGRLMFESDTHGHRIDILYYLLRDWVRKKKSISLHWFKASDH